MDMAGADDDAEGEREYYRAVSESIKDAVYVVDRDHTVTFVNERFLEAVGTTREAVLGTPIEELSARTTVEEGAPTEFLDALEAVLEGERDEARVELAATTDPLGEHVVETRLTPYEPGDEREGVVVVSRGITDRKTLERHLQAQRRELALLNRLLRHDVRNDLSVVGEWLAELEAMTADAHRDAIENARAAAAHSLELTEMAGDYARLLEAGSVPDLEPVALDTALRRELGRHRTLYPEATFRLAGELPAVEVLANDLLPSLFENLLRNAVEHNYDPEPTVTVDVTKRPDTVVVRIADDGPGPDAIPRERLVNPGAWDVEPGASGLGLALVGRLVDAYGGTVDVEPNDPEGSVVVVELRRPASHS